ncbi:ThiJ/PfpI family protein [Sandaracinus amylolyticus]|uniref:ThiJ/PfpI family protein n=2 Tax=Sandaracinus amylolyticus TaxID=927083 RepID=A0A0F6YHL6_9BACT|nr:ThiJ/PfpI family protein [Sandaracinus amylolyticus]
MVLTSHATLGNTGRRTGFWLEELAAPYYVFRDAGATIDLASPQGGEPPLDPKSDAPDAQTEHTRRFRNDPAAQRALATTKKLASVSGSDYDAVFYPGGHGPLWDLAKDPASIELIEKTFAAGRPLAAVCHAPGALRDARAPDGTPLVRGREVTGFTNEEEAAVGLTDVVPFLLEDALQDKGARFSKGPMWKPYVCVDRHLITGQNPASSADAARAVLALLTKRRPEATRASAPT